MSAAVPYFSHRRGDRVLSSEWNDVQLKLAGELAGHRHDPPGARVDGGSLPADLELSARSLATETLSVAAAPSLELCTADDVLKSPMVAKRLSSVRSAKGGVIDGDLQIDGDLRIDGDLTVDGSLTIGGKPLTAETGLPVSSRTAMQTDNVYIDPNQLQRWIPIPGLEVKLSLDAPHVALVSVIKPNGFAYNVSSGVKVWAELGILHSDRGSAADTPVATALEVHHQITGDRIGNRVLTHAVRLAAGTHVLRGACRVCPELNGAYYSVMHVILFRASDTP